MARSDTQFKPGHSGGGRKKGAKNKLSEAFLKALSDDFDENGAAAIKSMRVEKPNEYVKVIASLVPKDFNLNLTDSEEMTDDEARSRIVEITRQLEGLGIIIGTSDSEGEGERKTLN